MCESSWQRYRCSKQWLHVRVGCVEIASNVYYFEALHKFYELNLFMTSIKNSMNSMKTFTIAA